MSSLEVPDENQLNLARDMEFPSTFFEWVDDRRNGRHALDYNLGGFRTHDFDEDNHLKFGTRLRDEEEIDLILDELIGEPIKTVQELREIFAALRADYLAAKTLYEKLVAESNYPILVRYLDLYMADVSDAANNVEVFYISAIDREGFRDATLYSEI